MRGQSHGLPGHQGTTFSPPSLPLAQPASPSCPVTESLCPVPSCLSLSSSPYVDLVSYLDLCPDLASWPLTAPPPAISSCVLTGSCTWRWPRFVPLRVFKDPTTCDKVPAPQPLSSSVALMMSLAPSAMLRSLNSPPNMLGSCFVLCLCTGCPLSNTLSSPLCWHRTHFLLKRGENWVPLLASHDTDTSAASPGAQITTVVTKTWSFQMKEPSLSRQVPASPGTGPGVRSLRKC